MRDNVGATSLCFLSYDGMLDATELPHDQFSTSCFDGVYPVSIGKRANEIMELKPGKVLPRASHTPTKLATARTTPMRASSTT
jgi:hypothetical protein